MTEERNRLVNYPCPSWCSLQGPHETHTRRGGVAADGTVVSIAQPPARPPRIVITNVRDQSVRITLTPAAAAELARFAVELDLAHLAAGIEVAVSYAASGRPQRPQRA